MSSLIKKRKLPLPVFIVEDHNEALGHIYRSIGSKSLPFGGSTMVHFDAHPDLLLPATFDVDRLRDKDYVLSTVDIAEWILPAVALGHVSTVVWVKPPWADQMVDGRYPFKIGIASHQGKNVLRLTCPLPYFVSELLWVPEVDPESSQDALLVVTTLDPQTETQGQDVPEGKPTASTRSMGELLTKEAGTQSAGELLTKAASIRSMAEHQTEEAGTQSSSELLTKEAGIHSMGEHQTKEAGTQSMGELQTKKASTLSKGEIQTRDAGTQFKGEPQTERAHSMGEPQTKDSSTQSTGELQTKEAGTHPMGESTQSAGEPQTKDSGTQSTGESQTKEVGTHPIREPETVGVHSMGKSQTKDTGTQSMGEPQTIETPPVQTPRVPSIGNTGYILDIDLDFYSTANPFLLELGHDRFDALRRLYMFFSPITTDIKVLQRSQEIRTAQLASLLQDLHDSVDAVTSGQSGSSGGREISGGPASSTCPALELGDKQKQTMLQCIPPMDSDERRRLLRVAVGEGDRSAEDLHEAGCTCDDSPLPHRPSSQEQILEMIKISKEYLTTADKKPDMVTISRSSWDGYCPPEHVEFVQENVLIMLTDLFGQLDVTKDYATPEENP